MKNKLLALGLIPLSAYPHDGHGLDGLTHWHATDVLGFLLMVAVAVGAIWWSGRK